MRIRLIVPNQPADDPSIVVDTIGNYGPRLAEICGGFTATQGTGGWINADGALIQEPVTVFDCSIFEQNEALLDDSERAASIEHNQNNKLRAWQRLRRLAKRVARDLNQERVYLELDGVVDLVSA